MYGASALCGSDATCGERSGSCSREECRKRCVYGEAVTTAMADGVVSQLAFGIEKQTDKDCLAAVLRRESLRVQTSSEGPK
jgi:hypothetical protein